MKKAVIILSGGLDSTVLAHEILTQGECDLAALSFDYGQKHSRELQCAAAQAQLLGMEHKIIALPFVNELFSSDLLQSGGEVPHGHYEAENMKQTVVPNRNMIMLSIAAGVAISEERSLLYYGAHGGDHAIYPDCRPQFVTKMREALAICDWSPVELRVPFLHVQKDEIVRRGLALNVDFLKTWTCYAGGSAPCGECGSCVERAEAFRANNAADPLLQL